MYESAGWSKESPGKILILLGNPWQPQSANSKNTNKNNNLWAKNTSATSLQGKYVALKKIFGDLQACQTRQPQTAKLKIYSNNFLGK